MSELAVITGTTHGIGRVTSRELARAGKTVVMLCRDLTAAGAVRAEIVRHAPRATWGLTHPATARGKSSRRLPCRSCVRARAVSTCAPQPGSLNEVFDSK